MSPLLDRAKAGSAIAAYLAAACLALLIVFGPIVF